MALLLQTLLSRLPADWGTRSGEVSEQAEVSGVAEDSRRVTPGTIFAVHAGRGMDGHH